MITHASLYLFLVVISAVITIIIAMYAWFQHRAPGATIFGWLMFSVSLWSIINIMEQTAVRTVDIFFWHRAQYLMISVIAINSFAFSLSYTGKEKYLTPGYYAMLMIVPLISQWIIFTDEKHQLFFTESPIFKTDVISTHVSTSGAWFTVNAIYSYILILISLVLLFQAFMKYSNIYRRQALVIFIGYHLPVVASLIKNTGFFPSRGMEITPIGFILAGVVMAWGLFHYRMFNLIPIDRGELIDLINDGVLVLDKQKRIMDFNLAFQHATPRMTSKAIGQPIENILGNWKELNMHLQGDKEIQTEISLNLNEKQQYFDLLVSPINGRMGELGQIVLLRDITTRKLVEQKMEVLNLELEHHVVERTRSLIITYDDTLEGWARALEMRDNETGNHTERVTDMTIWLAVTMGMRGDDLVHIRRGAILHDIGKMGIPDNILHKAGPLNDEEWEIMRRHPEFAVTLLSSIEFLKPALEIPLYHHEKWDGTGYPQRLKGEKIPVAARIFAIVDVWDALRSDRPYRKSWPPEQVQLYIKEQDGKQFDPEVVEAFLKVVQHESQAWAEKN